MFYYTHDDITVWKIFDLTINIAGSINY